MLCHLAAPTVSADALERALHSVPETANLPFVRALEAAENIGRRDAESLRADEFGRRAQFFEPSDDNRAPNEAQLLTPKSGGGPRGEEPASGRNDEQAETQIFGT
ncbi:hypothetical protein RHSP_08764 [Rhizobium freirei PRF 81]|uniref:Uncharacterized protein n=2 Tax=Rhizobium freirei TaxID=1353277 RepID=N6V0P1_9HYPH|nr:hypothetical protein RHSP_08764 [Rhizobium freirei PRF 81]